MAKGDLNRRISVFIDGTQAGQGIKPVEAAIQKLEKEIQSLDKTSADYAERSKQLKTELDKKNKTLENYKKKCRETERVLKDLSGATYNELLAMKKLSDAQLRDAVPGTTKYNIALEQHKRITEQLTVAQKAMRVEVGCQGTVFGRAAGFVNKYAALFSGAIAGVTGLTLTVRKSVSQYAEMEEAMADVRKYTGMTTDEVKQLNEELKKMDTRTPREQLNALAADAGRLGITGKEEILEFVDAADKLTVALGEDLGEDAVKNIGKLAQMFGESDRLGLRGAMLATGSAINELAQNSSAYEGYIVDFTARLAGVGQQAKISQADIMGYASALDQNMQQVETSATVFSQLITKMFQQPERFANLAGMAVKDFTELLSKDANAALLQFLDTMQRKGGFDSLAPMFEEMKLNGTRAVGVLSSVATHLDQVREAQGLANKAYREGTSVINEYNVKNNTVQAGIDKAVKGFTEMAIALGEKLEPAAGLLISKFSLLMRVLNTLLGFAYEHARVITVLTASLVSYTVAAKASELWTRLRTKATIADTVAGKVSVTVTKLQQGATLLLTAAYAALTGNTTKATAAMRLFNIALKANPWGVALSAITALGLGIYAFVTRNDEATKSLREFNKELLQEQTGLDSVFDALKRAQPGTETRRKLLQQINDKYGTYLPNLLTEKSSLDEINEAYKRINTSLTEQIALKYKNEDISKVSGKYAKDQIETLDDLRKRWAGTLGSEDLANSAINELKTITQTYYEQGVEWQKAYKSAYDSIKAQFFGKKSLGKAAAGDLNDYMESYYNMRRDLSTIDKKYANWTTAPASAGGVTPAAAPTNADATVPPIGGMTDTGSDKVRKAAIQKVKDEYAAAQAELTKIYADEGNKRITTEKQYNQALLDAKKEYLQKLIKVSGQGSSEAAEAEKQLAELQLQERKQRVQQAIDEENEQYATQQRELQETYVSQQDEQLQTQEQYTEAKEQLELMHLQRMLEISGMDADARMQVEQQLLDFRMKCVEEELKARQQAKDNEVKLAEEKRKKLEDVGKRQHDTMMQYADTFGTAVGNIIAGQENALQNFGDSMVDIVFDVLEKLIDAELVRITGIGISTIAEAQAREIGTKGLLGIGTGAALAAVITAAIAAAKAGLKALIGGKRRSSTSDTGSDSPKTYQRVVNQHAAGKYDVIGGEDGRTYHGVPFVGAAESGVYGSPALIAERGPELIVNADDLYRLQHHINYPLVMAAIEESRRPVLRQHARGSYPQDAAAAPAVPVRQSSAAAGGLSPALLQRIDAALEHIIRNGVKAPVVLPDLEKKKELRDSARKIGSKS